MSKAAAPEGFVVITEVSPKDAQEASFKSPPKRDPLHNFYKGEPLALGITQIVCGIVHLFFGIVSDVGNMDQTRWYFHLFHSGTPFWYGVLSIISGSLSAAATKNPKMGMVRGSLIMNIITAVAAGVAIIMYSNHVSILEMRAFYRYYFCTEDSETEHCEKYNIPHLINVGLLGILLSLTVMGLCVSISVSVFGCKTLCRTSYSEVSVVIYQTAAPQPSQPNVSPVPMTPPDVGAIQPSFTDFEKAWSSAPMWKQ